MFRSFFILLAAHTLSAEIYEIHELKDANAFINEKTLVVCDLDNTVIKAAQMLGSDAWYHNYQAYLMEQGATQQEANQASALIWTIVQKTTQVKTTEAGTKDWLNNIKAQGNTIIALTGRPPETVSFTGKQLEDAGLHFHDPVGHSMEIFAPHLALYENGVLYASQANTKGDVLVEYFRQTNQWPESVVFIDDRINYVKSVDKSLTEIGIPVASLRYGKCDIDVHNYNHEIVMVQLESTDRIISDEEALEILNQRKVSSLTSM